eukprot:CAMPEP_0172514442 /NCGR_PEP_ID=MMETSP1066-20121228/260108_1 /TAXON_ID=671091 /ORGANISM="Coscinodiscus wailesii, Strain CCMP2513" /LENGTH=32 /DNA_ID= /DNA_START= /DNA_END= /DNA_ORIENTATION=
MSNSSSPSDETITPETCSFDVNLKKETFKFNA